MSGATMTNTGAALAYAEEFGWHVFTLSPNGDGKRPYPGTNGFRDATTDPKEIAAMFRQHPQARIAIRTGVESGMFVLDVDTGSGKRGADALMSLEQEQGELPRTRMHRTPRGGTHYFFKHPGDRKIKTTSGELGSGLDVRGDGGYVAAPPSPGYSVIE